MQYPLDVIGWGGGQPETRAEHGRPENAVVMVWHGRVALHEKV
jgi:hypothetical protein